MIHKLLILTSDPTVLRWESLGVKKEHILNALNGTKNGVWQLEVRYQPLVPQVTATGHIDRKWFDGVSYPLFRQGYHHVCLHFSMKQWELYGLKGTIRGGRHADDDFVGEMYIRADENTKRGRFNQFVQTMLHEVWHELCASTGVPDTLHEWHDNNTDITGADWSVFDMNNWQPIYRKQVSVVVALIEKLRSLIAGRQLDLFHPVQFNPRIISQAYGVANRDWYKITGHHIGTDYAIPVGTPLHAPWDGEVTMSGTHDKWGHYCHYRYQFQGEMWEEQWFHLQRRPGVGAYKRGVVVAYSGNTGFSTGPHLHRAKWRNSVDMRNISAANWRQLTVDPEA